MVGLRKRDHREPLFWDGVKISGTLGSFAKKLYIESTSAPSFLRGNIFTRNLFADPYVAIVKALKNFLPKSYYHRKREARIDSFLESV